ncbi:TonB-dependent receptor [Ichthyobacterium seriolicida]|uniref:TonB-dependent receptor n=2 Tax=Ichthyobacterium seriolicida TaxID=242600 RepID=A0A1J1EAM6_9FLAO|nr:TonB-dependent receptor [Ichthyobacterium seriolicida]
MYLSLSAMAQKVKELKEVVVTDTQFRVPLKISGNSVVLISEEDIEKQQGKSISQLINQVSGIEINGTHGNLGNNLAYYIRGGRTKDVLILINGKPLTDPSGISFTYDLRNVDLSQVQQIEIVKSGASALYGSNAATVIDIKLKKYSKDLSLSTNHRYSSHNTFDNNIQLYLNSENINTSMFLSNTYSDGFSSAKTNNSDEKFDNDGFHRQNATVNFMGSPYENIFTEVEASYTKYKHDYDFGSFSDGEQNGVSKQKNISIKGVYEPAEDLSVSLYYLLNDIKREDFTSLDKRNSFYRGMSHNMKLYFKYTISERLKILIGSDYNRFSMDNLSFGNTDKGKYDVLDAYFSTLSNWNGLNFHLGARLNNHSNYGMNFVYNTSLSYLFGITDNTDLVIKTNLSNSFNAPSLYQLFSKYGYKELKPEQIYNIEGGISLYSFNRFNLDILYFHRQENNAIIYDRMRYANIDDKRTVHGSELNLKYDINYMLSILGDVSLLWTDKEELFYKIPKQKYGVGVNIIPFENSNLNLQYRYTSKREENVYDMKEKKSIVKTLKPFGLLDLHANYKFLEDKNLTLSLFIYNLLDKDFMTMYGYNTSGISFSIGVNYVI